MNQNQRVFQSRFHSFGIGDEIRTEITAVELHTLDNFQGCLHSPRFFNGDHTVFADLIHRLGDNAADGRVAVGGHGSHLSDHFTFDRFRQLVD